MNIKILLITLMSVSNIALYATATNQVVKPAETSTVSMQPDTKSWVTFPITYNYETADGSAGGKENVEVSLPITPEPVAPPKESEGYHIQPIYRVADTAGMSFAIGAMPIPNKEFDLSQSYDFLIKALEKTPDITLLKDIPPQKPNASSFSIMFIRNGRLTTLKMIQTDHLVYDLETSVPKEIYLDASSIKNGTAANAVKDEMKQDTQKSNIFFDSFKVKD